MSEENAKSKASTLIAHSAFLVSLCAIGLSIYEVNILEEQKHASVWPRVYAARNTTDISYQVTVRNAGVGPAQIRYVEVMTNKQPIRTWRQGLESVLQKDGFNMSKSTLSNLILLPGDKINPLTVEGDDAVTFYKNKGSFKLKICYCSIYERCWTVDENDLDYAGFPIPKAIEKCPVKSENQFIN